MNIAHSSVRFFGVLVLFGTCFPACIDPCGNSLISESYSTDRTLRAVVFGRDCGATTGFSTQVSILSADERFITTPTWLSSTQSGNVFVAAANRSEAPTGPEGGPIVRIDWIGPRRLRITHDRRAHVAASRIRVNGVDIEYSKE